MTTADTDRWYDRFLHVLHHGAKQTLELALQRIDGAMFHAYLDCMRVTNGHAAPMVRIAMTDISERKEAEADMHKFEAQLRHVQKMESVGTLAGGIAHDFNNILGAIIGNVALAREELEDGHAAVVHLEEIQKASVRARNLVRQILTFSRREPQELLTQPLQPIVEETHKLLRATLPARVELDLVLADALLHVHADATQIQQVLMNLCTNAWHALKDAAGRIHIGLDAATLDHGNGRRPGGLPAGSKTRTWFFPSTRIDCVTRRVAVITLSASGDSAVPWKMRPWIKARASAGVVNATTRPARIPAKWRQRTETSSTMCVERMTIRSAESSARSR